MGCHTTTDSLQNTWKGKSPRKNNVRNSKKGTKICAHAYNVTTGKFDLRNCRHGDRCGFAHSKEQYVEALLNTLCSWDLGRGACRKTRHCTWLHSIRDRSSGEYRKETIDEYWQRTGKILGELPHNMRSHRNMESKINLSSMRMSARGKYVRTRRKSAAFVRSRPARAITREELRNIWQKVHADNSKKHHFAKLKDIMHKHHLALWVKRHLVIQKQSSEIQVAQDKAELEHELSVRTNNTQSTEVL